MRGGCERSSELTAAFKFFSALSITSVPPPCRAHAMFSLFKRLVKRLGVEEGKQLVPSTFELFLKNDAMGDPFINESHVVAFGWGTAEQLATMKQLSLKVNEVLNKLFDDAGLLLVDFKLEFGVFHGQIVLGDEFSPDGCRLWDKETRKKMDKDRFRQGLGDVIEAYEEVAKRLGVPL